MDYRELTEQEIVDKHRGVKELVGEAQREVSGVLCGLGVKLNARNHRFPDKDVGGPVVRS